MLDLDNFVLVSNVYDTEAVLDLDNFRLEYDRYNTLSGDKSSSNLRNDAIMSIVVARFLIHIGSPYR